MGLMAENSTVKTWLKGAIAIGMVGAMVLFGYKLYVQSHEGTLSPLVNGLGIVAGVALVGHIIEGAVAGAIAQRRGENALKASVYAFFTGFVGLTEILKSESPNDHIA